MEEGSAGGGPARKKKEPRFTTYTFYAVPGRRAGRQVTSVTPTRGGQMTIYAEKFKEEATRPKSYVQSMDSTLLPAFISWDHDSTMIQRLVFVVTGYAGISSKETMKNTSRKSTEDRRQLHETSGNVARGR